MKTFTALLIGILPTLIHANSNVNLTSNGCADASGFQTCQNKVTASTSSCLNRADADSSSLETLACGCLDYIGNFNCYATHCWNKVYECDYQIYITDYLSGCPTASLPVPYFPIPDNAPDACSCNVGEVYLAINSSISEGAICSNNVSSGSLQAGGTDAVNSVYEIQGCECCELSYAASSIYSICPDTDPTLIGWNDVVTLGTELDTPFDSCDSSLSQYNCASDLNWPEPSGGTFYSASGLPASGTNTLSNMPGTVTAPASGTLFTYTNTGASSVYTISAAGLGSGGASSNAKTTSGSHSSSGSGTAATSASSATSAVSSSKSNGVERTTSSRALLSLGISASFAVFFLV